METLRSFIDGAPFAGGGETIDNINPANGEPVCQIELADEAVVEAAVEAAKRGFEVWKNTPSFERGRVLMRAAALLRARNDELAKIEMTDTGKPISESLAVDIESAAEAIEYYGGLAPAVCGRQIDLPGALAYVRREPLGVCVGVGAWNYPLQIAGWKSALALACGNAMIFKPSEMTPTTALELAKIYIEAGLPRGVFNVALGDSRAGAALVKHPGVAKVSLTGAAQTGKTVMALAAATLKNVTFELGGKSPLIVFADSDLDEAVSGAMLANFYTQGEVCSNGTRVFLHKKIAAPFLERIVARADKMKIGDPADPRTQIGALISAAHARKVAGYIEAGRREGAALLCGGEFATDGVPAAAIIARRRFSPIAPTACRSCAKRFSGRCSRRCLSKTKTKLSPAPTTPITDWRPAFSRATSPAPIASFIAWTPELVGSTTSTSPRRRFLSAASSIPGSAPKTAPTRSIIIRAAKRCMSNWAKSTAPTTERAARAAPRWPPKKSA